MAFTKFKELWPFPTLLRGLGLTPTPPLPSLLSALGSFWQSMLSSHDQQDLHHIITLHHHIHEVQYRWPSSRTTLLPVFVSTERLGGGCIGILGSSPPPDPLFTIWLCPRTSGSAVPFDLYSICLLLCIILYCHVVIHTVDPNTFTLSTQHIPSPRCVCRPLSCWEIRWIIVSALLSTCIN